MALSITITGAEGSELFEFPTLPSDLGWALKNHMKPFGHLAAGEGITWQQMAAILTHVETAETAGLSDANARAACYAEVARRSS